MNKKIRTISRFKLLLLASVIMAAGLFIITSCNTEQEKGVRPIKNIVFVSSFNDNHIWSSRVWKAFKETLDTSRYDVNITNIYLDAKNIPDSTVYQKILSNHITPIEDNIDIIVGMGIDASKLLLSHPDSIVRSKPVICVSYWDNSFPVNHPNGMCIKSNMRIDETFMIARKMLPEAHKAYIVSDNTTTGTAFLNESKKQLAIYNQGFDIQFGIPAAKSSDLLDKLSSLEPNSFVILNTWQRGDSGTYYDPAKLYPQITKTSNIPVFSLVDNMLSDGFIGGFVENPQLNGKFLALNAISFFDGTPIEKLKIKNVNAIPIFNIEAMRNLNLPTGLIPDGSIELNSLQSFIDLNVMWIIGVALLSALFMVVIIILLRMNHRYKLLYRRSYKMAIRETNMKADIDLYSTTIDPENTYTWIVDIKNNLVYYPNGSEYMVDSAKRSITVDEFVSRIHVDDKNMFLDKLYMCVSGVSSKLQCTFRILRPEITEKYEWWEARGIVTERCDASGNKYKVFSGMSLKVQSYKEIEAALENALIKAEKSDSFKSEFLANMSHEIRTPLNVVVGFSELMITAKTDAERIEYGNMIRANSKMLLNLIDDILELSKIESGKMKFNPTCFDFNELFNETYLAFKQIIPSNIKLKCNTLPDKCNVTFDRQRLAQVLNNFLSNAVKYTQVGSITMKCQLKENGIKFSITDTGTGILDEEKERVFGRFEKIDKNVKGTGLGLAISKSIIEKCNGNIGFDSEYGKGSTFWAWIPCEINKKTGKNSDVTEIAEEVDLTHLKILVADDIKSNYSLIAANLHETTIDYASDGNEAVILARKNDYDCIFMDLKMPILDGFEATKQIRIFNPKIPIVAITAQAFDYFRREAFDAGCTDFITKPISKDTIIKILSRCIDSKK